MYLNNANPHSHYVNSVRAREHVVKIIDDEPLCFMFQD